MREIFEIPVEHVTPETGIVLKSQGIPPSSMSEEKYASILKAALDLFTAHSAPAGIISEITIPLFEKIYPGDGRNAPETPLEEIFPRADHLGLFTITMGESVSRKISELFETHDYAVASMLDTAASEGAEMAADIAQNRFRKYLKGEGASDSSLSLIRYSPGYCGWHISGQRALFANLHPEDIGIALRETFLMDPLKSISGVIVAGPPHIHDFDDSYAFCEECKTHECRQRIRDLFSRSSGGS